MKKIFFILAIILLINIPYILAAIGVGFPVPTEIELLRNETGRFWFRLDATGDPLPMKCAASIDNTSSLIVEFDDEEMMMDRALKNFYGSVSAPENLDDGLYKETFCVDCETISPQPTQGAAVIGRICTVPIKVKVVSARTKENVYIPPKPAPPSPLPKFLFLAALIVVLVAIIIFLYKEKKQHQKPIISKKR